MRLLLSTRCTWSVMMALPTTQQGNEHVNVSWQFIKISLFNERAMAAGLLEHSEYIFHLLANSYALANSTENLTVFSFLLKWLQSLLCHSHMEQMVVADRQTYGRTCVVLCHRMDSMGTWSHGSWTNVLWQRMCPYPYNKYILLVLQGSICIFHIQAMDLCQPHALHRHCISLYRVVRSAGSCLIDGKHMQFVSRGVLLEVLFTAGKAQNLMYLHFNEVKS